MAKTWRCGDCGTRYPKSVHRCQRRFDDYLALRGGSIESAITLAVEEAIAPLVRDAHARLRPAPYRWTWLGSTLTLVSAKQAARKGDR